MYTPPKIERIMILEQAGDQGTKFLRSKKKGSSVSKRGHNSCRPKQTYMVKHRIVILFIMIIVYVNCMTYSFRLTRLTGRLRIDFHHTRFNFSTTRVRTYVCGSLGFNLEIDSLNLDLHSLETGDRGIFNVKLFLFEKIPRWLWWTYSMLY